MKTRVLRPVIVHEFTLLARNTIMWFRFALFYAVFVAAMGRDVYTAEWDRFSLTLIGLMILGAVGVSSALSAESFAQEKDRGTMEAVLLVPTSARQLVRSKLFFIVLVSSTAVLMCFLTGITLVMSFGGQADIVYAVNKATVVTGSLACPPAIVMASSLGVLISCRVRGLQNASAAATISSIAGMLVVVTVAYLLSVSQPFVMAIVTVLAWLSAFVFYYAATSTMVPEIMLRTRGR